MAATINQPYIFLAVIYGGILIGIVSGILMAIRRALKLKTAGTIVCAAVFFVSALVIVLNTIYRSSYADVRLYTFFGFALGYAIFYFGLGKTVFRLGKR